MLLTSVAFMALPVQKVIFNCRNGVSGPLDLLGWAKPCVPLIRKLRSSSGTDRLAKEKKILMVVVIGTPN
jgi:hypothetical protein